METDRLVSEVELFTRYLTGLPADAYMKSRYCEYHSTAEAVARSAGSKDFDRFLVRFGTRSRWHARLADSYSALFSRESLFRQKLVLVIALLECSPRHYRFMDGGDSASQARAIARLTWSAAAIATSAVVATLVLVPMRWIHTLRPGVRRQQPC